MSEPFIAQIMMFGGNFAPRGWALCNGQILPIAQNTALFSLLGTTFGGNGQTTFALPDLRGRVPVHPGSGPGLTPRTLGEVSGSESVTLNTTQMPAHSHSLTCNTSSANQAAAVNNVLAEESNSATQIYSNSAPNGIMNPASIGPSGGNQPHANMQPFVCVNFIIALEGIFPSRN